MKLNEEKGHFLVFDEIDRKMSINFDSSVIEARKQNYKSL